MCSSDLEIPARLSARDGAPRVPDGWDGAAAERIVDVLERGVLDWPAPRPAEVAV